MKEYTITYTAEITEVWKSDEHACEFEETCFADGAEGIEIYLENALDADDVHVRNVKVFEREVSDDDE